MLDIRIVQRSDQLARAILRADILDDELTIAAITFLAARLHNQNKTEWLKFAEWCWDLHQAG